MSVDLSPYICRYGVMWLADDPEQRHRSIPGTVVFTDLSGFTALSERLATLGRIGSEEMATQLDRVFTALLAEARDRGGSLVHFGGDALILLFNGPDHEVRGTNAAAAMLKALKRNALMRTAAGSVRLGMSTGVWSGDVDLFLLGQQSRHLLISGPAASGVARLEAMAQSGEILLSEATAAALPPSCVAEVGAHGVLLKRQPRARAWTAPDIPEVDLEQLMPVTLRRHLLAGGGEPEHRSVTVGFIRWTGIDDLLDSEGADAVAKRLDELVGVTEEVCLEWGLTFLATDLSADGGKIMVAAGAPISHEDDESRALHAMRKLAALDPGGFGLRIGLQRGHAFAAAVGAPFRRTYTCIGDTVNTAARIMSQAKPGQVLATDDVLVRSRTLFAVEAMPEFLAKGKAVPLQPYAVGEEVGTRIVDDSGTIVGREEELARLAASAAMVAEGGSDIVIVEAPAGMGKTTLLQTALAEVPKEITVLRADCSPYAIDEAFATARPVVRQALGGRSLAELAPHLQAFAPLLAAVTGDDVPMTPEVEAMAPAYVNDRLRLVVAEVLDVAVRGPLLVVVDDLQWADQASVDLLTALVDRRADGTGAWLARRQEESPRFGPATIALGPLTEEAALRLVRAHSPVPLVPVQARALVERAGGNALFLRELARAARAGVFDADDLPADLESVVASRLDRLAPTDLDLLKVAAVIGPEVDVGVIQELAPQATETTVWTRLEEFLEGDRRRGLRFRHAMYRQVAYGGLPFRRRRDLHGRIGDLLEQRPGAAAAPDLLSWHFTEAQRWDKAWGWSLHAADLAERSYAYVEEVRGLQRALVAARGASGGDGSVDEVRWRLVRAARRSGDPELSLDQAKRLTRSGDVELRCLAYGWRTSLASDDGDQAGAIRIGRRGLKEGPVAGGRARCQLLETLGTTYYRMGRLGAARSLLEECLAECGDAHPGISANALNTLGVITGRQGGNSKPELERAQELYLAVGDRMMASKVLGNLGVARYFEDDWLGAERDWRQSREAQEAIGYAVGAGYSSANLAELAIEQGDLATAEVLLDYAAELAVASRYSVLAELVDVFRVALAQKRMDLEEAEQLIAGLACTDPEVSSMAAVREVEQALLRGDPVTAGEHLRRDLFAPGSRARLEAVAAAQRGSPEAADLFSAAAETEGFSTYDRGLAYDAWGRFSDDPSLRRAGAALLSRLSIRHITVLPVRPGESASVRAVS